jgi:hypothetical protein
MNQFQAYDFEPLLLEAGQDGSRKAPLYSVGFEQHQCPFHVNPQNSLNAAIAGVFPAQQG